MSATLRCGRGVDRAGGLIFLGGLLAATFGRPCLPAQAATKAEPAVGELVDEALFREIYARDREREELLDEALNQLPGFPPARWHTGHVWLANRWVQVDDVPGLVQSDKVYCEYVRIRPQYPDTVAGQLALGNWCRARRLEDQARAHFIRVLDLDPDNVQARSRLGHQRTGDVWSSPQELEEKEARARRNEKNLARWKPKVTRIHYGLLRRSERERVKARARLLAIDDPAAIPAIELVLAPSSEQEGLLAVEALGNITDHEASQALGRQAVFSAWPRVRFQAAYELKARPMEAFVPAMLAMMYTPIQAQSELQGGITAVGLPMPVVDTGALTQAQIDDLQRRWRGGGFIYRQILFREGWTAKQEAVFESRYRVPFAWARTDFQSKSSAREGWVADQNVRTVALNGRICSALNVATGQELAADPQVWWKWWDDRNETVPAEKPLRRGYTWEDVRFVPQYVMHTSCFAAGTVVWSVDGPTPIEQLRIGDLVLAQHPETGQLAYKPVLRTTVGPPLELVKVLADSESFDCTGGHLFWVSGKGWVRARELQAGDVLHGVAATTLVAAVQPGPKQKALNLVVADFNTYFVGRRKILVHDVTPRQPTTSIVPGLKQQ